MIIKLFESEIYSKRMACTGDQASNNDRPIVIQMATLFLQRISMSNSQILFWSILIDLKSRNQFANTFGYKKK